MNKVALITGASSGIGLHLARQFAAHGHDVALTARSLDKLHALAEECRNDYNVQAHVVPCDLAEPDAACQLWSHLNKERIEIDYLANNAGFQVFGSFDSTDLAQESAMIQVNLVALTQLTKLALQAMLPRGRGRILNVASVAGFQPVPHHTVYSATKAYVLHFTEALAEELRGSQVTVSALCPGPTATSIVERSGLEHVRAFQRAVADPADVARIGYQGMIRGKRILIPGWRHKLVTFAERFAPRETVTIIAGHLMTSPKK